MRKSVLLKRIVVLVLTAIFLSGLLAVGMYSIVAQKIFSELRAQELLPIARRVAQMALDDSKPIFERGNSDFLKAQLYIYDENGNSAMINREFPLIGGNTADPQKPDFTDFSDNSDKFHSDNPTGDYMPPNEGSESITKTVLDEILAGAEVSKTVKSDEQNEMYLVVGVPISDSDGVNHGAVVFTKRLDEMDDTQVALIITLLISTVIACLIMLFPSYYATKRITGPIRNMSDISLAMARGDFSVRVDENQKGELGELARSMNVFADESEKLEQTRRDYVANVSHELRTPLASIRAMSETLQDGLITDPDKKMTYYGNIIRETIRLSRLVNDMLELSRLQSDGMALEKREFQLSSVLDYIVDAYMNKAEDVGQTFVIGTDLSTLPEVYSNSDRIEQVLVILLDNALKHTPSGGVITLSAAVTKDMIEVSISDTGDGISQEDVKYIFDRFYKADKSHSSDGNGLGLSIAWEVMRMLHETIRVESKMGEGSRFIFTIHLKQVDL